MFLDGYLGLVTAINVTAGTNGDVISITEVSAPGYARQAITFGEAVNGVSFSAMPYTFGQARYGQVGRAIFSSPTPGDYDRLLLVLPYATPAPSARPPWEQGDVGHVRLFIPAMSAYPKGSAFSGPLGFEVGQCSDAYDVTGTDLSTGTPRPIINTAKLYTQYSLRVVNGTIEA